MSAMTRDFGTGRPGTWNNWSVLRELERAACPRPPLQPTSGRGDWPCGKHEVPLRAAFGTPRHRPQVCLGSPSRDSCVLRARLFQITRLVKITHRTLGPQKPPLALDLCSGCASFPASEPSARWSAHRVGHSPAGEIRCSKARPTCPLSSSLPQLPYEP